MASSVFHPSPHSTIFCHIHLSVGHSAFLSICLSIHLSVCLFVLCLQAHLSSCLSVCLSNCPTVHLSNCLIMHLSNYQPYGTPLFLLANIKLRRKCLVERLKTLAKNTLVITIKKIMGLIAPLHLSIPLHYCLFYSALISG